MLIPSFAVGRTQAVLVALWRLRAAGELPDVPVFLDSPMAVARDATPTSSIPTSTASKADEVEALDLDGPPRHERRGVEGAQPNASSRV